VIDWVNVTEALLNPVLKNRVKCHFMQSDIRQRTVKKIIKPYMESKHNAVSRISEKDGQYRPTLVHNCAEFWPYLKSYRHAGCNNF